MLQLAGPYATRSLQHLSCCSLHACSLWPLAEVLLLVRDEVLQRLGQRLPPEMQLLEAALSAGGSKERLALLQRYAALGPETLPARPEPAAAQQAQAEGDDMPSSNSSGGAADGPWLHCLAADLERAASQVVEDMELMLEVPDRWAGRHDFQLEWESCASGSCM